MYYPRFHPYASPPAAAGMGKGQIMPFAPMGYGGGSSGGYFPTGRGAFPTPARRGYNGPLPTLPGRRPTLAAPTAPRHNFNAPPLTLPTRLPGTTTPRGSYGGATLPGRLPTITPQAKPAAMIPQGVSVKAIAAASKPGGDGTPQVQDALNPTAKINEWMMKCGHLPTFVIVPDHTGGFTSTLVLPLEGAGDDATVSATAPSKKLAKAACSDLALQKLYEYGLLDILTRPSKKPSFGKKNFPKKGPKGQSPFAELKNNLRQQVLGNPGQSTLTYLNACPPGTQMERVYGALADLEKNGQVYKTDAGETGEYLWHPSDNAPAPAAPVLPAKAAPGNVVADMNEVKMICFDILSTSPGLGMQEVVDTARSRGHGWDVKLLSQALLQMEREGTVRAQVEASMTGVAKRWFVK